MMDHEQDNKLDPPNNVDFAFDRVEDVIRGMQNLSLWLSKTVNLKDRQETAKRLFFDHPILCVFAGVLLAMCSVPVFCFFVFAVTTASFLFLGFLLVEGTILACALLVLLGAMFVMTCLSIGCTIVILMMYYITMFVLQLSVGVKQKPIPENVDTHND